MTGYYYTSVVPVWGRAEACQHIWCSSSSLCCLLFRPDLQTQWEWTTARCVWCNVPYPLNRTQLGQSGLISRLLNSLKLKNYVFVTWSQTGLDEDSTTVPAADWQLIVVDRWVPIVLGTGFFVLWWGQWCWWSLWTYVKHKTDIDNFCQVLVFSYVLPRLNLVSHCGNLRLSRTEVRTCPDGSGRLESSLNNSAISVHYYQSGLLGTQSFSELEGGPSSLQHE